MVFLWQTRVKKSPFILLDIALSTICPEASVSHDRWSIYHHPSKPPRSNNNNNNNNNNEHLAAGPSCPESRTSQESRTWEGGSHRSKVIIAGGGGLSLPDLIPTRLHLQFFGWYLCFYDYSSCIQSSTSFSMWLIDSLLVISIVLWTDILSFKHSIFLVSTQNLIDKIQR